MKNEIGRKLTSLTIMAIMFAGGMAIGVPSFMPEAASDLSVTEGVLTVSTTTLQGAAILEIVVNDPDISDTDADVTAPTIDVGALSGLEMTQGVNGKWYLYVVDKSVSALLDADGTGLEFGIQCLTGLGTNESATTDQIVADSDDFDVWAETVETLPSGETSATVGTGKGAGGCQDIDNMEGSLDGSAATIARQLMSEAVLQNAPSLSNPDGDEANLGQRAHQLNASGFGSWPYIISEDLADDNIVSFGSDSINVVYGNTDDETSISIANGNPADNAEIHLTITDPALNIDPTTADIWIFDLSDNDSDVDSSIWATNGTNTAMDATELGDNQCVANCALSSDGEAQLQSGTTGTTTDGTVSTVQMTETGANTGVFESWNTNGNAEFETRSQATADSVTIFSYGGNSVDMIITYNDAAITMGEAGQTWIPGESVTISVNDPDANRDPTTAETLSIGDETVVIPTIKVGSPLTLANGGTNTNLGTADADATGGVVVGCSSTGGSCTSTGGGYYDLNIYNTTDNSERLRIILNAEQNTHAADLVTWVNVTTSHSRDTLVNLAGTVVLSYDVSGAADLLGSTAISVYLTDSGSNTTNDSTGLIALTTEGNQKQAVLALDAGGIFISDIAVHSPKVTFGTRATAEAGSATAGSTFVSLAFKFTHAAGNDFNVNDDFAISADFCNFDQNNASLTHNCIYRLEAVETGADTGIFEGTVEYLNLVNSTGSAGAGSHAGNANAVAGLLGYVTGDALTVVLMDGVSGSDSVRVVYNDTDAFQGATKIGAQLETSMHTGTVDLDADTYGADDIGTITIVDADLNQDSTLRDTYTNSSTTFQVTISTTSGSVTTSQKPFSGTMTIIETEANSGVFVGTFKVPDFKGADMEITYYEARDASSSAVEYYDTATITSNTGSIALDRNVYPVPFASGDLYNGGGTAGGNTATGSVIVWITVSDADEANDTLTTTSTSAAGAILLKHTNSTGSTTCFTAGSIAAVAANAYTANSPAELGPLSETSIGSQAYETSATLADPVICGGTTITINSGDVIQASYVDTADDAGVSSTQFDSSTFDLRTGSLSVDKDVYVMGSDMVVTITDPDLNLDSGTAESYSMNLVQWDSAADSNVLLSTLTSNPSSIEETGSDTGVFQTVTTIPELNISSGNAPDFGEAVTLTYVDAGLSGENNVADDTLDVEAYFSISNFGALVELDKAVYGWTDTVYVTITSPDHNTNTAAEETIGTSSLPIQATTRNGKMCTTSSSKYFVAAETGPDTGVFTSEIGLTGYSLSSATNAPSPATSCSQSDSTASTIQTKGQTDGISVSYEYTDAVVVVASASIIFNIGTADFDTSSASSGGSAVLTVSDSDANTDGNVIQTVTADVYSDSDNGGFTMTLSETDEDTGVFEGTVFFTTDSATSGSNLRVSEGDTVTAEFSDPTLPEPYTDSDSLTLAATLTIGTAFPPLERAPADNARVVDAFGASVAEVTVDQQVQIAADVSNGQSSDQAFAYLVQVQDENGVTVSLAWITGSLTAGQSMSPALSWTPGAAGTYTATVFVWESVDNPTALSPTTSVTIDVV